MQAVEIQTIEAPGRTGGLVVLKGHIYAMRRMGSIAFMILRDRSGTIQVVVEDPDLLKIINGLSVESVVSATGQLVETNRPPGAELKLHKIEVLSEPASPLPVEINKDNKMESLSLSSMLDYRPLTLRNEKVRSIFKIEAALCSAFREFLSGESFTEIHSPKVVATGTEGGAQLFKVDYFGRQAYLAQSPQFYKQIMVGVFERVFEIGPVYRAEEHDTSRHLNEYISMDYEMGFVSSEQDVIAMQVKLLKHMFRRLKESCPGELALYNATVPEITEIPQVTHEDALKLLTGKLGWSAASSAAESSTAASEDLDPEGEKLLCQYFLETHGCDLVYVTHYPRNVRPFYAMPLEGTRLTRSFDLLFRGVEVTTGGQRIHKYDDLVAGMGERGLNPEKFSDYLQCFRYGMPPHGGLAIGLERMAKQLLDLPNIKLAALFPRDLNRISP